MLSRSGHAANWSACRGPAVRRIAAGLAASLIPPLVCSGLASARPITVSAPQARADAGQTDRRWHESRPRRIAHRRAARSRHSPPTSPTPGARRLRGPRRGWDSSSREPDGHLQLVDLADIQVDWHATAFARCRLDRERDPRSSRASISRSSRTDQSSNSAVQVRKNSTNPSRPRQTHCPSSSFQPLSTRNPQPRVPNRRRAWIPTLHSRLELLPTPAHVLHVLLRHRLLREPGGFEGVGAMAEVLAPCAPFPLGSSRPQRSGRRSGRRFPSPGRFGESKPERDRQAPR